ncbi:MAG: nucleotidyltransferase family protein [Candidatus Omnitrophica bacterium]|nr:nucleotidyltransferase family protein [Candidatus Omnitrophota bacterium]MBU1128121.1 nucleotidyltransferase family protein [Candidatus Omnitrophota bacterium]MBU1784875.1 nucleotidyltransferase family protein [Candidatus Omnitrophota bacterium]MBU1850813.1 nucleotidyltransferase family protein [Candidatus Omnitrophota bacterium]
MSIDKIKKILRAQKRILKQNYGVEEIGIFGSCVREKQNKDSDVDLLVKIENSISLLDLVKIENYLTDLLGARVDLVPKEDIREELKKRILSEVIYV